MTVKQITQTRFEVELDSNDLKTLSRLTDMYGQAPDALLHEIINKTFNFIYKSFIVDST